MKLLALDTSSPACSVALVSDDRVFDRHEERAREHTRLLMPMISSVVEEANVSLEALDAIVLGNGPGSFIGMRIATSVAQGLAYGAGLDIVPVSSLAAVAAQVMASEGVPRVAVAQDAHMREVYLGLYEAGPDGLPEPLVPERLHGRDAVAELRQLEGAAFVPAGDGWRRYPDLLAANRSRLEGEVSVAQPSARFLLAPGAAALKRGAVVAPEQVNPAYLRQKVAQKPAAI